MSENREAAFMNKITASVTHEIRNVLAIIKESAGLIEDMVRLSGEGGSLMPDKLMRAVDRIGAQVNRGAELMANLNRLSHSLDRTGERVNLNQEVRQVAGLIQRFAKLKGHLVEVRAGDEDVTVAVNPLWLQMALYTAVECCLEQLPAAGTVTIQAARRGDRAVVELMGEVGDAVATVSPSQAGGWNRLAELADGLGAAIEADDSACRFRVTLPVAGVA